MSWCSVDPSLDHEVAPTRQLYLDSSVWAGQGWSLNMEILALLALATVLWISEASGKIISFIKLISCLNPLIPLTMLINSYILQAYYRGHPPCYPVAFQESPCCYSQLILQQTAGLVNNWELDRGQSWHQLCRLSTTSPTSIVSWMSGSTTILWLLDTHPLYTCNMHTKGAFCLWYYTSPLYIELVYGPWQDQCPTFL